ncbi:DMT family transporter [Granulicella sp. dw_53]|uniref:DMT family transporter n=1 Tax=Granulicella sp. dw_53 TaxID=2719792 RepID=UPI001BD42CDE|nr:DMT family transporter [Granulicella sp. dw_53]
MSRRLTPSALAHLLLLAVVIVWGSTFALVKDALQDVSPLLFNLLRMAIAFLVLAILNHRLLRKLPRRTILSGLLVGLFLAAGYQFQTAGLARTTPAKSAFITGMVVVFVPLFTAFPILRPRGTHAPRWNAALGALLAFTGLLLLTTPPGTHLREIFSTISLGDLLTLACAIAFTGHLLALAHISPGLPALQIATLQIGFAALIMAITLPLGGPVHIVFTSRLFIALAVTSLLATAAAFTIQSWAQQHLPPTHTAILLTLEPVFAWLTSLLFLDERLGPRPLTGAALILIGIICIELLSGTPPIAAHAS